MSPPAFVVALPPPGCKPTGNRLLFSIGSVILDLIHARPHLLMQNPFNSPKRLEQDGSIVDSG